MYFREYKRMDGFQKTNWWYHGRRFIVKVLFQKYVREFLENGSVLDVGCGVGESAQFVSNPAILVGIDNSNEALAYAKRKGYLRLVKANADELPFDDASFKGVISTDVIEHVEKDNQVLSECNRVLKIGGFLLITVPAYQWLWSYHDVLYAHKRRYGKSEIVKKISHAGFEIVYSSYYVTVLFPLVAGIRYIKKTFQKNPSADFADLPRWVNQALFFMFTIEGFFMKRGLALPFGSSIFVFARKTREISEN